MNEKNMKRKVKKLLSLLLAVSMVCSGYTVPTAARAAWDGVTVTAVEQENGIYQVSEAAELAWVAREVNNGNSFAGETIELTADIDLNNQLWIPIGTNNNSETGDTTGNSAFEGTFDGRGHTISGLYADHADGGTALFGYSVGIIKDVIISGTVKGGSYSAGLVAYGSGTLTGIVNEVSVYVDAESNYVGGILGDACGCVKISDCHNRAEITNGGGSAEKSTGRIGGIVGRIDSGIDQEGEQSSISNCSNTGDITGYQYVSGIIGGCFENVRIEGCYNTGTLTGISFGKVYTGGIAGKLHDGTIDSCYNLGDINITPWGTGHIRAVGGIAGCEENHPEGTAITNCYSTGTIELDTSKMTTGRFIYLVGGISGGNNSNGNTMGYEDCFYLEGCIPSQYEDHESYMWWNEMFRADHSLYDTESIVACEEWELKSDGILNALGDKFMNNPSGGYPILYWQENGAAPALRSFAVSAVVTGGTASVNVAETAEETTKVTFTVTGIQDGKIIKEIRINDISGSTVSFSREKESYFFTMPSRAVKITVILENTVSEDAESYHISMPEDLDAIWDISINSSWYDPNMQTAAEGATVTVSVNKNPDAITTSFSGITVHSQSGEVEVSGTDEMEKNGARYYGEYSFTMPGEDVTVAVDIFCEELKVYVEEDGLSELKKACTREEMEKLSTEHPSAYYSGWSTETEPFIGIAEQYISLEQVLAAAGAVFEPGDRLKITSVDNFSQVYTYDYLIGTKRCYYQDIFENGTEAQNGTIFGPAFVLKGNLARTEEEKNNLLCDTLNTYRFVFGQSETELKNAVKIVDSMPKSVVSVTVIKAEKNSTTPSFPVITLQPCNYTGVAGETAVFMLEAEGEGLSFRWQFSNNGSQWRNSGMEGNTGMAIYVPITAGRNGQKYRCIINDANGNELISEEAVILLKENSIKMIHQPEDSIGTVGQTAVFAVEAEGQELSYQWQYSKYGTIWYNSGMRGFDTAAVNVPVTDSRNGQLYRCVIKDANGDMFISDTAVLLVVKDTAKPEILVQPHDFTGTVGDTAVFTVETAGEIQSIQWQYSKYGTIWYNSGMPGNQTTSVEVPVTSSRINQKYRCVITGFNGESVISDEVSILSY